MVNRMSASVVDQQERLTLKLPTHIKEIYRCGKAALGLPFEVGVHMMPRKRSGVLQDFKSTGPLR